MISSPRVYSHSGALGTGAFMVPLVGLLSGLVLALVYAYVTVYSPIAGYVSILFVLGLGFGVGFLTALAAKASKCRNPTFLAVAGGLVGVFTLYASWVFFEFALMRQGGVEMGWGSVPAMFLSPGGIWEIAKGINVEGWYSIRSFTPSGFVLWAFWAIEAAIIVGMIAVMTVSSVAGEAFCEGCNQWIEAKEDPLRLSIPQDDDLRAKATSGDLDALGSLTANAVGQYPHMAVELKECPQCRTMTTYQVKLVEQKIDDDGKAEEEETDLSEILVVVGNEADRLKQLWREPALAT